MSMVEKVARALASEHILAWAGGDDAAWVDANWRWHTRSARAAIEAMEPTEAMVEEAASSYALSQGPGYMCRFDAMRAALTAARQAALEGEG